MQNLFHWCVAQVNRWLQIGRARLLPSRACVCSSINDCRWAGASPSQGHLRRSTLRTVKGGLALCATLALLATTILGQTGTVKAPATPTASAYVMVPEPQQPGGEPQSIVQVANLVYAGTKSSKCFSDHFLAKAEKESAISTSRRFHAVKLASEELYAHPLVIMTGEGEFTLPDKERENLRRFVERGGMLLASSGCSSADWDRSFRREMAIVFTDAKLGSLAMDHAVFHTIYDIAELKAKHGKPKPLEGVTIGGRLGVIYSPDGLNDTEHSQGCCCCGGNEITNCVDVNVNILAYALMY
jgi:hypothetical protein